MHSWGDSASRGVRQAPDWRNVLVVALDGLHDEPESVWGILEGVYWRKGLGW